MRVPLIRRRPPITPYSDAQRRWASELFWTRAGAALFVLGVAAHGTGLWWWWAPWAIIAGVAGLGGVAWLATRR